MNQKLIYKLSEVMVEYANKGQLLTYSDLCRICKIDISPRLLGAPLGEISSIAYELGLPLLSALVCNKSTSMPGDGFYQLFVDLKGKSKDPDEAWVKEVADIYACNEWDRLLDYLNPTSNYTMESRIPFSTPDFGGIDKAILIEDQEEEKWEGRRKEVLQRIRDRNHEIVEEAKRLFRIKNGGRLYCEVCGFSFESVYGELGDNFAEGHHKTPLSELPSEGGVTNVEDIAVVCSNCHRILHRRKPYLLVDELKERIKYTFDFAE